MDFGKVISPFEKLEREFNKEALQAFAKELNASRLINGDDNNRDDDDVIQPKSLAYDVNFDRKNEFGIIDAIENEEQTILEEEKVVQIEEIVDPPKQFCQEEIDNDDKINKITKGVKINDEDNIKNSILNDNDNSLANICPSESALENFESMLETVQNDNKSNAIINNPITTPFSNENDNLDNLSVKAKHQNQSLKTKRNSKKSNDKNISSGKQQEKHSKTSSISSMKSNASSKSTTSLSMIPKRSEAMKPVPSILPRKSKSYNNLSFICGNSPENHDSKPSLIPRPVTKQTQINSTANSMSNGISNANGTSNGISSGTPVNGNKAIKSKTQNLSNSANKMPLKSALKNKSPKTPTERKSILKTDTSKSDKTTPKIKSILKKTSSKSMVDLSNDKITEK